MEQPGTLTRAVQLTLVCCAGGPAVHLWPHGDYHDEAMRKVVKATVQDQRGSYCIIADAGKKNID